MKRRVVLWTVRRLIKRTRARGAAGGGAPAAGRVGPALALGEALLAKVWRHLDTPAARTYGARFVSRMRSSAGRGA
jgi:hypothetical protein